MCTGVEAGYVIAAVGAATSAVNVNQAQRRQDKELASGIIEQGKLDEESSQRLTKELQTLEQSGPEEDRKVLLDSFRSALRENQDLSQAAVAGVPGASERFAENVAAGREQIAGGASKRAGLLSRIDAPIRQRQRETLGRGRLAVDFGDIARRSESADFLARLRASQQVPNPFVGAVGEFAQAFGGAKVLAGNPPPPEIDFPELLEQGTLIDAPVQPRRDPGIFNV